MDVPILDISYEQNHTTYGLLYLTSLPQRHVFRAHHMVTSIVLCSSSWPSDSPLSEWTSVYVSVHLVTGRWAVSTLVTDSAAMNICAHVFV